MSTETKFVDQLQELAKSFTLGEKKKRNDQILQEFNNALKELKKGSKVFRLIKPTEKRDFYTYFLDTVVSIEQHKDDGDYLSWGIVLESDTKTQPAKMYYSFKELDRDDHTFIPIIDHDIEKTKLYIRAIDTFKLTIIFIEK
jgi:hypothetical protein